MDRAHWVKATQRQYGGHGGGYPSGYTEWLRSVESTHGNAAQSTKRAYLYKLVDKDGNLLKWGITDSPAVRYPGKFMEGKDMIIIDQGSRSQILQKERHLVETDPGPLNFEPWAGARVE